jgi:hypothetical protein
MLLSNLIVLIAIYDCIRARKDIAYNDGKNATTLLSVYFVYAF